VKNLKITIIQSNIVWQNIKDNLDHLESLIKENNVSSDLIILPEMFNTGFTMEPEKVSEEMNGDTVNFIKRLSHELGADITGSIPVRENGLYYNRLLWAKPKNKLFTYDKRHLFRMAGEGKIYSSGNSHLTINLNGWKIRPFICYDLRFPVWSRNSEMGYDIAVFTANWPAARDSHWDTLLRARAIENQCYVAGVNRIGRDGNGIDYNGRSAVIDYCGNTIFNADNKECVQTVELSYSDLSAYRESFPAWMDSDGFTLL